MTIPRNTQAQPVQYKPLQLEDFSGGITDYFLDTAPTKYEKGDNLLIYKHGSVGRLLTRPGSEIYDATNDQIPAGAQRVGTLIYFNNELFVHSSRKIYYVDGVWDTLQGPVDTNDLFPAGTSTTTAVSHTTWQNHLFITNSDFDKPSKIFKDDAGDWQVRTAGLPKLTSAPIVTQAGTGSNYIYRFIHKYEYKVGTLTYIDRSSFVEVALSDVAVITGGDPSNIDSIPVLANGAITNYDTSNNMKIEIYRTKNNGTTFYLVDFVNNGTVSTTDNVIDADLETNQTLYTEGGVVENDEPPLAKLIHVVEDKGYYAHTKSGTEVNASRCFQSVPGDPDSVPATFFVDVDDNIIGLSDVRGTPVLACEKSAYRVDGDFDLLGRGAMVAQKISDRCSCVSAQSVVQTLEGIFWAGDDGFYFSDAYNVTRISDGLDKTYAGIVGTSEKERRIVGRFDPKQRRIWWTVQTDGSENDTIFVLDLNWGISNDMPFTTLSGGDNFAPTAIEFIEGDLIRGDSRGFIFRHSDVIYTDPTIDLTQPNSSLWGVSTIVWDFISTATSFGTTFARKWTPRIGVLCEAETDVSIQINSINDLGRKTAALKPIRFTGNLIWGDANEFWGDRGTHWNFSGIIDEWRRVPAQSLRCQLKQVQLTNAQVVVITSDILGTVDIDATAKTATLVNAGTLDLPDNIVGYFIAFEGDGYINEYLITASNADVITFTDPTGAASTITGQQWAIRGKPKGNIMNMIGFIIHYAIIGKTNENFTTSGTGEVGS